MRLSDTDVAAVSAWLARQTPPPDAAPEAANLQRMRWR
jgi:cytochrome c553